MNSSAADAAPLVRVYHDRTKHHLHRYARSLGFLDWANQPDPFRRFAGCEQLPLEQSELRSVPTYDALFGADLLAIAPLDRSSISRLFQHCLALSAWKQASPSNSWSLRINPSSGALHPTEGYLICGAVSALTDSPGVFHYSPWRHELERRCDLTCDEWQTLSAQLPPDSVLVALTSIYWREAWKYGERAFRYCNHDVGHAIGAITFAARLLGWEARVIPEVSVGDLSRLLGVDRQTGPEAEHADCVLALFPPSDRREPITCAFPDGLADALVQRDWHGQPNALSDEHHEWPLIDEVAAVIHAADDTERLARRPVHVTEFENVPLLPDRGLAAEQIIRQRRSAVDMDGETMLGRDGFFRLLQRTMPSTMSFPFHVWPHAPRVSLALFVHRVRDLEAGLYVLVRSPAHEASLRRAFHSDFDWSRPEGCPDGLNLFLLRAADARSAARTISCHQDIAADGSFAVGMLAEFDAALNEHGAAYYPRLFWETGLIGQVLYLEAEAAGVRGTGIGCFFDDAVHQLFGIADHEWQSLYHFTIGGPVLDVRLKTLLPYAHLGE